MRKLLTAGVLLFGGLALAQHDLKACGDKFLLVGRGVRFQRAYAAVHPAVILICLNAKSRTGAAIGDPQFLSGLKLAGHTVHTTRVAGSAAEILGAGRYDLVLTDLSDAAALVSDARATASKPLVLPILYRPTKGEAAAAAGQFGTLLTTPDRMAHVLSIIDDVMSARLKAGKANSVPTE
jgi:hypothetical protein